MHQITILNGAEKITVNEEDILISTLLNKHGINLNLPCGGNHTCGKCKVEAMGNISKISEDQTKFLSVDEIDANIRLACFSKIIGDAKIKIINNRNASIIVDGKIDLSSYKNEKNSKFGVAVDIGTTTIVCYLVDIVNAKIIDTRALMNRQGAFGADVISRIEYCNNNGLSNISGVVINQIEEMINSFNNTEISQIVITGNTTMLHILTKLPPKSIAVSPFLTQSLFGAEFTFNSPFRQINSKIYLPRCISAYVGADITSAILASNMMKDNISILCDIGTNGEMVIKKGDKLYCCATAAGPAFEGAGLYCGSTASSGAINKVYIENSQIKYTTIDNQDAVSICGTGIIDAMAVLKQCNIVDETGRINEDDHNYLEFITEINGALAFKIPNSEVVITASDIRQIQLAKSAICAGIYTLIEDSGINHNEIDNFYIAGGFGSYINIASASAIGLIPEFLEEKASVIGNGAGIGAVIMLLSDEQKAKSEKIAESVIDINLSTNSYFLDKYVDCMMF